MSAGGDFSVWSRPGGLGAAGGATALVASQEYTSRANLHYTRGISRPGVLDFDIHSLDGKTAPTIGDYVEVRYSTAAAPPWSGVIREIQQDKDDLDLYHVTAMDPLGEIDKRNVGQRLSYAGTTENAVATDICSKIGITTTSFPIRIQAASVLAGGAGNTIDATGWACEFQDGLPALRALANTYGREITVVRESNGAGGFVWTLYYLNRAPDATKSSVVQATWSCQAGDVGKMKDITDDWDKAQGVTVIPNGDGLANAPQTVGAPATSDPQYVIPAKGVKGTTAATALATTLQNAFSANRRVLVAPVGFPEPLTDGGADLGYLITLKDETGSSIGNFRVAYLEVDEEAQDGFYARATCITGTLPALPAITNVAGVRQPGLALNEDLQQQHEAFVQPPATSTLVRLGSTAAATPKTTTDKNGTVVADASTVQTVQSFNVRSLNTNTDDGMQCNCLTQMSGGVSDYLVTLDNASFIVAQWWVKGARDGEIMQTPVYLTAAFLADILGAGVTVLAMRLTITNRSGANRTATRIELSTHIVGQHQHVG